MSVTLMFEIVQCCHYQCWSYITNLWQRMFYCRSEFSCSLLSIWRFSLWYWFDYVSPFSYPGDWLLTNGEHKFTGGKINFKSVTKFQQ